MIVINTFVTDSCSLVPCYISPVEIVYATSHSTTKTKVAFKNGQSLVVLEDVNSFSRKWNACLNGSKVVK